MDKNLDSILNSIRELAQRAKVSQSKAFAAWYSINFYDLEEDDALEAAEGDGGNDQGIDVVFADDSSQSIVVLQAHLPENFDKSTEKRKWDAVTASLPFIKNPEELIKAGRPDLAEAIDRLKSNFPEYSTSVGLISLGKKNETIDRSLSAQKNSNTYEGFDFFYMAQAEIIAKYESIVESENGIQEDHLKFCDSYFEDKGEYGRAWVGSVSALELKRLHDAHQDKLFAGNIRLFLGSRKGGINEQIIKTAKEFPGKFWALNNGVTIVADHADPFIMDGKNTLTLKRFSIVNGCQTTSSLVRAEAPQNAKVLIRVIAAKAGLKNEIVRYNNSQNAVKIWAVRAVDDIQDHLRTEFESIQIKYAPKQEGSRMRRSADIIELDKVTQFLAASEQQWLIQAIDNKSQLFDEPYQKIFKKGIKAAAVYLAWLIGGLADKQRQDFVEKVGDSDPSINLLGVTSVYWIVYCTHKLLNKYSDLSASQLTLTKMVKKEFSNALTKYIDKAIEIYYDAAIDTYNREEYGSFRTTLRSAKFLSKLDSKVNAKIGRLKPQELPHLTSVCKSIK